VIVALATQNILERSPQSYAHPCCDNFSGYWSASNGFKALPVCGRFTYRLTWREIVRLCGLTHDQPARNTQARYNVCPTDPVDTIVERDGKRELEFVIPT
jgi:hypothetical protein